MDVALHAISHRGQSLLCRQRRSCRLSHRQRRKGKSSSTAISNLRPADPQSIEKLGFKFSDMKILLISHGHFDHCAGSADDQAHRREILRDGSRMCRWSNPGGNGFRITYADRRCQFPTTHVDRALHDGDTVILGGTTLTAHLTAGHTKGTTTWTMDES